MQKVVIILLVFISFSVSGQTKDPYAMLKVLKSKYAAVNDYTVDATVSVDVKMLNMPVKKVKVYYKFPDKVHVETKGFAMLPKKATGFNPGDVIGDKYTAIYIGTEKWGTSSIDVIKTIPADPKSDVILSTFWIDEKNRQIRKMEVNSKTGGSYQVDIEYNKLPFDLPQKLTIVFDVKEMNMPKTLTGELPKKESMNGKADNGKGKVSILYSNYKVNTGLSDSLFADPKKKPAKK